MSVEGFLTAIRERPEDDDLRLVFTDWLDDHGQPDRAEFIRLQVRRARAEAPLLALGVGGFSPRPAAREAALAAAHKEEWLGDIPTGVKVEFQRGLLHVWMDAELLLSGGIPGWLDRCFYQGWVERLELKLGTRLREVLASSCLRCVSQLLLGGCTGAKTARLLADADCLAGLRALTVIASNNECLGDEGVTVLAAMPHLARLEALSVSCHRVGPAGIGALMHSPYLGSLVHLDLSHNRFGEEACQALARAPNLPRLRQLDLSGNNVTDEGLAVLATSPALRGVTTLKLCYNEFGADGVQALTSSPHVAGLTRLYLAWHRYGWNSQVVSGDAVAEAIASSLHLHRLELLALNENTITDQGVRSLAEAPRLPSLKSLSLGSVGITDKGVRLLAESSFLTRLEHLHLEGCLLLPGVQSLASSPNLASLTHLSLQSEGMDDRAAECIASSPSLTRLTVLHFGSVCHVGRSGVRSLAFSECLERLAYIYSNPPFECIEVTEGRRYLLLTGSLSADRPGEACAALVETLKAEGPGYRKMVVEELRQAEKHAGDPEAKIVFTRALLRFLGEDPDGEVRIAAARAVSDAFSHCVSQDGGMYYGLAFPPSAGWQQVIRQAMRADEAQVRECMWGMIAHPAAVDVFGIEAPSPISVPWLLDCLSDSRTLVRRQAVLTLLTIRAASQEVLRACRQFLDDADPLTRGYAALVLAEQRDEAPEVLPALLGALRDAEASGTACTLLSRFNECLPAWPLLVEVLRFGLASRDVNVVQNMACRLTDVVEVPGAWPVLIEALSHPDEVVRRSAEEAVSCFPADDGNRRATLDLLGAMGAAAAPVAGVLRQAAEVPTIRLAALDALFRIGGEAATAGRGLLNPQVGLLLRRGDRTRAIQSLRFVASVTEEEAIRFLERWEEFILVSLLPDEVVRELELEQEELEQRGNRPKKK